MGQLPRLKAYLLVTLGTLFAILFCEVDDICDFCGRAHGGPVYGFLVFWLQNVIEHFTRSAPFKSNHNDSLPYC